ncbi:hypothetical protein D3C76_1555090 [compost metagenome]
MSLAREIMPALVRRCAMVRPEWDWAEISPMNRERLNASCVSNWPQIERRALFQLSNPS